MANIFNNQTTQTNITLVSNSPIDWNLKTDDLEAKVKEIYGDVSRPVLTKFPDLFVLFDPASQISINIFSDQKRIIVSDNQVSNFSVRDLLKLSQLAIATSEVILKGNSLAAFGFNILATFDLDEEDSAKLINTKIVKTEIKNCYGAGVSLLLEETEYRNYLRLEPMLGENLTPTKAIKINQNSHFVLHSLPTLSDLAHKIENIYSNLPITLGTIFK